VSRESRLPELRPLGLSRTDLAVAPARVNPKALSRAHVFAHSVAVKAAEAIGGVLKRLPSKVAAGVVELVFYKNEGALLVEGNQVEQFVSVGKRSKLPSGITSSSSPRQDGSLAIHS
jgi:hypothetical protein